MVPIEDKNIEQIEYLVQQSTQGLHFLFEKGAIVNALKKTEEEGFDFYTFENKNRVQGLLVQVIERASIREKQTFLESLSPEDHDLLIQAYFHLVENSILTNSKLKH